MVKIDESLIENLIICKDNISLCYIGSVLITFLSVAIACFYHVQSINSKREEKVKLSPNSADPMNQEDIEVTKDNDSVSTIKSKQYVRLTDKIAKTLTEDQLKEEKQVEREQLEAIFKLLQNQEEKFQIGTLQELEDQMKLYRY